MRYPFQNKVRRATAIAAWTLALGEGPGGVAARAWRLWRNEGLGGVRRGWRIAAAGSRFAPGRGSGTHDRNDYTEWVERYDTLDASARAALRERAAALPVQPLISVLMPTYNSNPRWLRAAIESVQRQLYPHWELCIADDASTDLSMRPLLRQLAREDPRIRLVLRDANGHISAASNSALELAAGAWVVLLDHDDLLAEHALYWVAEAINRAPHTRMIYSDEDKLSPRGRRYGPYFKCDWNADLFLSQNLFSHLGAFETALVREVGGFRTGFEGSQDYDLALRCAERIDARQIHHIPRVLYHWRVHAQSTALSNAAKPYAALAAERALNEHLQRRGVRASARRIAAGYKVDYALPAAPPLVSLIVPTRNGVELLRNCIESILRRTAYPNYEIVVVDNASDDAATLSYLEELGAHPRIRVLRDARPFNFSALNNTAVQAARGELLCLLNNDIEVISPDWLDELASHALQPGVGAVGARLLYPDGSVQHAGVVLGLGGCAGHPHRRLQAGRIGYCGRAVLTQEFAAVTGACMVIRKSSYAEVGGLNETDFPVAFNDVDFCLRLRARGYRNLVVPAAELLHHESATRGADDTPERRARLRDEMRRMLTLWGDALFNDPAYSPNLTLHHEDLSCAWPPRLEHAGLLAGAAQAEGFNEWAYLSANPDVADAVMGGQYASGYAHYQAHGRREQRPLDLAARLLME